MIPLFEILPKKKVDRDNSFRKAFYHLQMAREFFQDCQREAPGAIAGKVSKKYDERLKWIFNDFKSNPQMPKYALNEFSQEYGGDIMFHESVSAKCLLLTESQKEIIESIIDDVVAGVATTVQIT